MSCTTSPGMRRGNENTTSEAIASDVIAMRSRFRTEIRTRLPIEPERRGSIAVVEARARRVILHVRPPRSGESDGVEIDVVLLLRGISLDVEDDLAARFDVTRAHLLSQQRDDLGIADVAAIPGLFRHVQSVEGDVRIPRDAQRGHD